MDAAETLAFVDLETTGGNPAYHRITEIGIVLLRGGALVEEWSSLVNPECLISPYIQAFTGISDEMVARAPRFAELAPLVAEKLRDAMFIAHNARFDYSFLRSEFRKVGVEFSADVLCTVKLSRRLFPEHARHNLDVLIERHSLTCSARHRALGDAQVIGDLWLKLQRATPPQAFATAATQARLVTPKLAAHFPPGLADELPEAPGAYRYFGEDDRLLYVGKSNSLRNRILDQLADDSRGVRRVDWRQTAGELGARLLEAEWSRSLKLQHNRNRKDHAAAVTLRVDVNLGTVRIESIDALKPNERTQCCGVFAKEKDARKALVGIAAEQGLCLKVLGVEESSGSCIGFQLGKCRGACIGKEPLVLHRMRLKMALAALKIKSWPFPGRIALRERGPVEELHVLDHWTHLGSARSEEELATLKLSSASARFDIDIYKILLRYFAKHPKLDWHDLRVTSLEHE